MNQLYQTEINLCPVGIVSSSIKEPSLKAHESGLERDERKEAIKKDRQMVKKNISEIHIDQEWQDLLDGIDDFSHVLIIYWPHLLDPERRKLHKVHPMGRKELPLTGIFATRSPARPNPLLVSVVRILERKENILKVLGFEAVDGSPILDIKPHMKAYDTEEIPKVAKWMEQIQREHETED